MSWCKVFSMCHRLLVFPKSLLQQSEFLLTTAARTVLWKVCKQMCRGWKHTRPNWLSSQEGHARSRYCKCWIICFDCVGISFMFDVIISAKDLKEEKFLPLRFLLMFCRLAILLLRNLQMQHKYRVHTYLLLGRSRLLNLWRSQMRWRHSKLITS